MAIPDFELGNNNLPSAQLSEKGEPGTPEVPDPKDFKERRAILLAQIALGKSGYRGEQDSLIGGIDSGMTRAQFALLLIEDGIKNLRALEQPSANVVPIRPEVDLGNDSAA